MSLIAASTVVVGLGKAALVVLGLLAVVFGVFLFIDPKPPCH